ncbi:DAK2 domain-containing protein [Chloroflexota bacterium]
MSQMEVVSGQDFREMFAAATTWLEKCAADVDALNVFPVPDGDTGTNMLLTMKSAVEESYRAPDHSVSSVAQALSKGALMGARGNSGVILSQFWRGLAKGLENVTSIKPVDMAKALKQAFSMAYAGLSNPVEGTILTVINDAAAAAEEFVASTGSDLVKQMEAVVKAASDSVANTPNLLPVLKDAGVVDAGGQGLYTILEGALHYLKGEHEQIQLRKPMMISSNVPLPNRAAQVANAEVPYGYCTEFLLKGTGLDCEKIREKLEKQGESLIVVGDDSTIRVHVHTTDPGKVIKYVTSLGTIHKVSMRNMDEQLQDFMQMQKERMPVMDMAIVAVVPGDGLAEVFRSLGVSAVVPGGQTMNPSTRDLLQVIESVPSEKIIILPNNKNVILTAEQVYSLTSKSVKVVPTRTVPQGISALLSCDYEADLDANVELMVKAAEAVQSIEITRAVRSTKLNGFDIKKKQAIGILNGKLIMACDDVEDCLKQVLSTVPLKEAEIVTIYYGADTSGDEAQQVGECVRHGYPHLQIEIIRGGQPHYNYIASVE